MDNKRKNIMKDDLKIINTEFPRIKSKLILTKNYITIRDEETFLKVKGFMRKMGYKFIVRDNWGKLSCALCFKENYFNERYDILN